MAGKVALDLKHFKHVKSDKNSTILQHKDGHQLMISHASLPKEHQQQLQALSKLSGDYQDATGKGEAKEEAKVQKFADKGMVEDEPKKEPDDNQKALDTLNEIRQSVTDPLDTQAPPPSVQQTGPQSWSAPASQPLPSETPASPVAQPPANPAQSPVSEQQVDNTIEGSDAAKKAAADEAKAESMGDPSSQLAAAESLGLQGIQGQAEAEKQASAEKADLLTDRARAEGEAISHFGDATDDIEKDEANLKQDIADGFISPEKYWTGIKQPNGTTVGGHSKIAAGIGMLIAGFNPAGEPNAAMNFLKQQMDMNLAAQAQNLQMKNNLLAHNVQKYQNFKDGLLATSIAQNNLAAHQIDMAAAKAAANGGAQARAQIAKSQLLMANIPLKMQLAMSQAMLGMSKQPMANEDPDAHIKAALNMAAVRAPEQYKALAPRFVDGFGMATRDVPEAVRNELVQRKNLTAMTTRLFDFAKSHSGSLSPADIEKGTTMANEVQSAYRQAIGGGVWKAGESHFIDSTLGASPTAFFNKIRVLPKLDEIVQSNNLQMNNLAKGYGLRPQANTEQLLAKFNESRQGQAKSASTPHAQTVRQNGKTYTWNPNTKKYE